MSALRASPPLDERRIAAATLASLPDITPDRLGRLLRHWGSPQAGLRAVCRGHADRALGGSRVRAKEIAASMFGDADVTAVEAQLRERGTHVWLVGDDDYPILDAVAERPPVLFGEGERPDAFEQPRVAIVGTRAATHHGLEDARELGGVLARAGVTVVSGLAVGIDGAAHEGALDAGGLVVGVVATGLDIEYPRRHRDLYKRVREQGVVVTEHGYGVPPHPPRFPFRNRIIAAISELVVVPEATATGGTLHTVKYAIEYGRGVHAMPGSRRNPAAVGCNALIGDGAVILRDPGDLLVAIGRGGSQPGEWRRNGEVRPPKHPDDRAVLRALGGDPATIDAIEHRTGFGPVRLGPALRRLEGAGAVERHRGLWWPT